MRISARIPGAGMGRDIGLYWWGQTTSAFGSVFTAIALPIVAVVHLGASPGQMAVISAASIVPALVLGMPAGALADRIRRPRLVLIAADTGSAAAVAVVAVGLAAHVATIGWLALLGAAEGATGVLVEVVYFLHLRDLVGVDGLAKARAGLQAGQYAAGFVGRLAAGPAIVMFGGATALVVDGISYLLSASALLAMRRPVVAEPAPSEAAGEPKHGFTAGARYFLADAYHRALLVLIIGPVIATSGAGVLTAPFLLRVVHVPTAFYGILFAVCGLAGLAGSLLAGRALGPGRDARTVMPVTFALAAVSGLLVPLAAGPLPLAVVCATAGLALPALLGAIANVALGPVVMGDAPPEIVGRVVALLQLLAGVGALAGTVLGGVLGDVLGVRPALWTLAVASAAAVALCLPATLRIGRREGAAVSEGAALARTPG